MISKHSGFTLIEMLVVMSLLAVIMLGMGSALRAMAQTESRVDERLLRNDQIRVTAHFLSKAIGRIDIIKSSSPATPGGQRIQFSATADRLSWIGIMPARHGAGGRYFFHVQAEETPQGNALVLRYAPWSPQAEFPDWAQSDSQVLTPHITRLLIEAEGLPRDLHTTPANWPLGWQVGWPVTEAAPQRIRLTIADDKGTWSPIVIALQATIQSQPGSGGFTIGGAAK